MSELSKFSKFSITSDDFEDGGEIPKKFGYDHGNASPSLNIHMPAGVNSIALIMDDPDAEKAVGKVWVHWVMYNIASRPSGQDTSPYDVKFPIGKNIDHPLTKVDWIEAKTPEETKKNKQRLFDDHQTRFSNPDQLNALGGALDALTDFSEFGYGGPAPPDKRHTYIFKVYALDIAKLPVMLDSKNPPTKASVEEAMKGHILAEAKLTGTFAP